MKNPYTHEEAVVVVTNVLAGVLGLEADEIAADAAIVEELDADSLDFVELNSNLEKKFNFTLPKLGPLSQAGKITGAMERFYSNKTGLTAAGVELMKNCLSQYENTEVGMTVEDVFNKVSVNNLASLCHNLFNYLPKTCPECGHEHAKISAAGKVVCASCSTVLRPLPGDEADAQHIGAYLQSTEFLAAA